MKGNLVNEYYNKILSYSEKYDEKSFVDMHEDHIKEELGKVIETNNHYLLTDSLLDYLSSNFNIIFQLKSYHHENIYHKLPFLVSYFEACIRSYNSGYDVSYVKRMSDEEKAALFDAIVAINQIKKRYHSYVIRQQNILYKLIYYVLGYCFINNNILDFKKVYQNILDNPDTILDDLALNDIDAYFKDPDYLSVFTNRVVAYLDSIGNERLIV